MLETSPIWPAPRSSPQYTPIGAAGLPGLVYPQSRLLYSPAGAAAQQCFPNKPVPNPRFYVCWQMLQLSLAWPTHSLSYCWQVLQPSPAWHSSYPVLAVMPACECCSLAQHGLPPNPPTHMPKSVTSLPTKAHPQPWLLCSPERT